MNIAQAFRQLTRRLRRSPGFTFVTILTLALGIGANSALFSLVYTVLIQPLPFPEADRLVGVWHTAPPLDMDQFELSAATYLLFRQDSRTLEELGLYNDQHVSVTGEGVPPERISAASVTPSLLSVLRAVPERGRLFREEEESEGAPPVVLLSHRLWEQRFGADPGVLGRRLRVDGVEREIVGVLPPGFRFPSPEVSLWLPFSFDHTAPNSGDFSYPAVGRLRPGATPEQVAAELDGILPRLPERFPGDISAEVLENAGLAVLVHPLRDDIVGDVGTVLWLLLGSAGFLLLIACANVANLFLVRAEGRAREVAVRAALGASRAELARFFLVESVGLGLAGGVVGLALAAAAIRALVAFGPENLPRLHEVGLGAPALAFTALMAVVAGLLFGLVPVLRHGSPRLAADLKQGGRGGSAGRERHRVRNALVVTQVALALMLLVGSGLMVRSFWELRRVDPGFRPQGVLTLRLALPEADYPEPVAVARFFDRLLDRLRGLPGVEAVGAGTSLPLLSGFHSSSALNLEDFPVAPGEIPPILRNQRVMPGFFRALGIPLREGRLLERADAEQRTGALVVNEAFARRFWPDGSAVGKRLRWGVNEESPWFTIVGVVGDVRSDSLAEEAVAQTYFPPLGPLRPGEDGALREPFTDRGHSLVIRTAGDPLALAVAVRREVWALDPNLPVASVRTLDDLVAASTSRTSFTLVLLLLAGGVALLLGAVGLYGVVSYVVSLRTREIGVRMALGADRHRVGRLVLVQGLVLAGVGVGLGIVGALGLTRVMGALLYGVTPIDPMTFTTVPIVLLAVAVLAAYLPARRAAGVDPLQALQSE